MEGSANSSNPTLAASWTGAGPVWTSRPYRCDPRGIPRLLAARSGPWPAARSGHGAVEVRS
eukprot:322180-Pyramimonas_sp.AAC.1